MTDPCSTTKNRLEHYGFIIHGQVRTVLYVEIKPPHRFRDLHV